MHRAWIALGFILALLSSAGVAAAEKRVALVIGNGAYKAQRLLENPSNDAKLIAGALAKVRFDVIETKTNLGIAEFRQALRQFQSQADGAEVALVYFAGHGIEANNANWLIPTDAVLAQDRDLDYEAIKADLVLQALHGARMRVLVLDACRDNPFGRNWRTGVRNTGSGLAKIEADDVLVLFAAAPGRTASDGTGSNSPFATALSKRLPEPGVPIQLLGGNVRDDVLSATGGSQRPYVSASITGRPFYLVPGATLARPPPEAPPPSATSSAAREWQDVKDTTSVAVLEGFVQRHKDDPVYAALARERINALTRAQQALLDKTEADRVAAEQRQQEAAEDKRKAEEDSSTVSLSSEAEMWIAIRDTNDPKHIEEYLRQYPKGRFVSIAKWKLEQLKSVAAIPKAEAGSSAGRRVALVIGNSKYHSVGSLRTPTSDAGAMQGALSRMNFDLIVGYDLSIQAFREQVEQFKAKIKNADIALLFYSGHGVQFHNQNYLLPVDIELSSEADVAAKAIALNDLLVAMGKSAKASIIFLDACRDSPRFRSITGGPETASQQGESRFLPGLAPIKASPANRFVGYAAAPGKLAEDGRGNNSPFTRALVRHIDKPVGINAMFTAVSADVLKATANRQQPEAINSLDKQLHLNPSGR